jgi:hypothetical protein
LQVLSILIEKFVFPSPFIIVRARCAVVEINYLVPWILIFLYACTRGLREGEPEEKEERKFEEENGGTRGRGRRGQSKRKEGIRGRERSGQRKRKRGNQRKRTERMKEGDESTRGQEEREPEEEEKRKPKEEEEREQKVYV